MISSCIDMIYNEEESWSGSDSTKKELIEFVDQLEQLDRVLTTIADKVEDETNKDSA